MPAVVCVHGVPRRVGLAELPGRRARHAEEHIKHVLDTACAVLNYGRILESAAPPCNSCSAHDLASLCVDTLRAHKSDWKDLLLDHTDPSAALCPPLAPGWGLCGSCTALAFFCAVSAAFEQPLSALDLCDSPCREGGEGSDGEAAAARRERMDAARAERRQRMQERRRRRRRRDHDEL